MKEWDFIRHIESTSQITRFFMSRIYVGLKIWLGVHVLFSSQTTLTELMKVNVVDETDYEVSFSLSF